MVKCTVTDKLSSENYDEKKHLIASDVNLETEYKMCLKAKQICKSGICETHGFFGLYVPSHKSVVTCMIMHSYKLNLRDFLALDMNFPTRLKLTSCMIRTAAKILFKLHSKSLIHGDIKSENIFLLSDELRTESMETLVFGDFGLSAEKSGNYIAMSDEYRAPEIWLGYEWGTPADVWGLGCVALEMLTGGFLHVDFPVKCETKDDYINSIISFFGIPKSHSISVLFDKQNVDNLPIVLLIERMLCINPSKRITVKDILEDSSLA